MKILYCNKYNFRFSGTEAYLFETMELMRARGHEVALFSMADPRGHPTPYDRYFVTHTDFKGARGWLKSARLTLHSIHSREARLKIRGLLREFRPDIAHVRNIYHHLSPSILWELRARQVPVLYHMNDLQLLCPSYNMVTAEGTACGNRCEGGRFWRVVWEGCYSGGRVASLALALEAYVHRWLRTYERCVDMVLTPSQFARDLLVQHGWDGSRICVLPHFQKLPLEPLPHPGAQAPILYFGRLSPEKGLADLMTAMAQLPHVQLLIAGEGPQQCELERLSHSLQLQNVNFCGHLSGPALDRLIARSQFTVFPSHAYETLGKSILESYAQGRTVVASDLGSRRELVKDGETGLLYRAKDPDQLAAAIAFLVARPELSKTLGEAGRQRVQERHSQAAHLLALTKLYEQLADRRTETPSRVGVPAAIKRGRSFSTGTASPPGGLRIAFIGGRGIIGKYSGIETYYEQTGRRLAAMGHDITAYCRTYFTPPVHAHVGIRIVRLPTIRSKHLDTFLHTLISTVHACFHNYDIVHYHTLGPALFSFLPRLMGKKTIVTVQGLDWQRKKWDWFARQVLRLGEWSSVHLPNRTVVVSQILRERYRSFHLVEADYVPNGTEIRRRVCGSALERFGLKPDGYVLFLGRFSPEKNCHLLIAAFEKSDMPFQLVLAGGSSHTDDYVNELRLHQSRRVRLLDWLSGTALEEVLTNAALFVLPSDLEGLSLALLDAMGAGVCVLASDVAENCEVLGDAGFTFRQGSEADLRYVMTRLLSDPELRNSAGRKAQLRVQERYLWDGVARQMESIYLDLAQRSRPPKSVPQEAEAPSA
ncbi:MAG TPA: glycosyltransferase family 4 protein [Terriglobales bacterium]|nr:glycosyltransferase family 4 protein [Terriglobales bacterium]